MSEFEAVDVAEYVMNAHGEPTAVQTQKLMFYAHAIHLARTGEGLVPGGFEAWKKGPVSPAVYAHQRGDYAPHTVNGDPSRLTEEARESVRLAIELYGDHSEAELVGLSHSDGPWTLARGAIHPEARSHATIDDSLISTVLVPTIGRLIEAYGGSHMTLEEFEAAYAG